MQAHLVAGGDPPQTQLLPGLEPGHSQKLKALCMLRTWGIGAGGRAFWLLWALLQGHPGLRRKKAGLGYSLQEWVRRWHWGREKGPRGGRRADPAHMGALQPTRNQGVLGSGYCLQDRPTWLWCLRSHRPLVGFPQSTGPAPEEEGMSGPGLGWGRGRRSAQAKVVHYRG